MRNPWNLLLARHLANSYDILFRQEQLTQSKYAFVSSNDNRNLRKYIIDFIVKITNVFSNRATSEHSATLLKFIYIVWATPKRFFLTIRREIIKLKPNQSLQVIKSNGPNSIPQKYCFRCNGISRDSQWTDRNSNFLNKNQKEKEKPSSEQPVTYCTFQFPGRTKSAGNGNFTTRVLFVFNLLLINAEKYNWRRVSHKKITYYKTL